MSALYTRMDIAHSHRSSNSPLVFDQNLWPHGHSFFRGWTLASHSGHCFVGAFRFFLLPVVLSESFIVFAFLLRSFSIFVVIRLARGGSPCSRKWTNQGHCASSFGFSFRTLRIREHSPFSSKRYEPSSTKASAILASTTTSAFDKIIVFVFVEIHRNQMFHVFMSEVGVVIMHCFV